MLIAPEPTDWKDLQEQVGGVLRDCGMTAIVGHRLPLARGHAEIDVFATDHLHQPPSVYVCECKRWESAVRQSAVHALHTVVQNAGANWGLLIARKGFQSGAFKAAERTNIKLLGWEEFQELFQWRWIERHLRPTLLKASDALLTYRECSEWSSRLPAHFDRDKRKALAVLHRKHAELASFVAISCLPEHSGPFLLPLRTFIPSIAARLPADLAEEALLRPYLQRFVAHVERATQEFDELFDGVRL